MSGVTTFLKPELHRAPIGKLIGHSSPTFFLRINEEDNLLISVASDKSIKVRQQTTSILIVTPCQVWDLENHECLSTSSVRDAKRVTELQACAYSPATRSMLMVTDELSLIEFEQKWVSPLIVALTNLTLFPNSQYKEDILWWKDHASSEFYGGCLFRKVPHNKQRRCTAVAQQ